MHISSLMKPHFVSMKLEQSSGNQLDLLQFSRGIEMKDLLRTDTPSQAGSTSLGSKGFRLRTPHRILPFCYDGATRGQRKMRGTRFNFMLVHCHCCSLIHLQSEVSRSNWQQKTWSIWASIDLFSPWLILKIKAMAMWCESKRLIILRKLFSTLQHPSRVSSLYFVQFAHIHSSFIRYSKLLWNQITVSLSWSKKRL